MGCIVALAALAVPRLLMVIVFLATDWFGSAFETRLWPILGFLCLPYATLAYMGAMLKNDNALTGGWLALFIVAVIVDAGHWGGSGRTCRRKS